MSKSYHNTTDLDGLELAEAMAKSKSQEEIVLQLFKEHKKLSASQVLIKYPVPAPVFTSVRRAISNLKHKDMVFKTKSKRWGIYGKPEYIYELQ